MSDPEMTPGDEAPAPEAPQIDPRAAQLWDGLNDLDRRPDILGQVLRPGQDLPPGMDWQQARALLFQHSAQPAEEPPDVFEETYGPEPQLIGYDAQGNEVYDQPYGPQPQGFDPRSLAPVFDTYEQQITQNAVRQAEERVQAMLLSQAAESAIQTSMQQVAQTEKLTPFASQVVESMARKRMESERGAPADVIKAVTAEYLADVRAQQVAAGASPVQGSPAPGGMIPGDQVPRGETWEQAAARSRADLARP